jgi:hypothetical protein
MGTVKENPNKLQIKEAKTTRPHDLEKSKDREYRQIQKEKPKKVKAGKDHGAGDEEPFDAINNNIHKKR